MALATQCPHCHTTFRVAHDQLKLRAGLVRCGACKQIFNGIENLLRPEDTPPAESAEVNIPTAVPDSSPPPDTDPPVEHDRPLQADPMEAADEAGAAASSSALEGEVFDHAPLPEKTDDPLLRMTLMDFAHGQAEPVQHTPQEEDADDPVEQAIDDLQNKPWRQPENPSADAEADPIDQADAAEYEEPSFVRKGRRRQRIGRALHVFMACASVFLVLGLLAQGTYVFRDRIAAAVPGAAPFLVRACARLGCQVGLPARIDAVSIESSELQTLSPSNNSFSLSVLLRNHSSTAQAWPNLELTLNDANEKPLVRRVFNPREYLPDSQEFDKGFAPRSEQSVKLFFETAGIKASGYRVYVFYP